MGTFTKNRRLNSSLIDTMADSTIATGFNKSKEDFLWFIKKAIADKKSDAYAELYHCLLKMFVDADTNKDCLVSKASFSKLMDIATSIFRIYGYAPDDVELYKTEEERDKARQKMFESMDLKSTGVITFDEWVKFYLEHIKGKTATLDPHPILDNGNADQYKTFIKAAVNVGTPENTELYWFLIELFTEADHNKNDFTAMFDKALETPKKLGLSHPEKGLFET